MSGRRGKVIRGGVIFILGIALLSAASIAVYLVREDHRGKQLSAAAYTAFRRGNYDVALEKYDAALGCRMSNHNLGVAYGGRSGVFLVRKEFDPAIRDLSEALRRIPNVPEALAGRAFAYLQKGEVDRAVADYSQAIKLAPNFFPALLNRGKIFLNGGKVEEALADLDEAVRANPKSAEAFLERGRAYEQKGDWAAAVASFESAQRLDADHPTGQQADLEQPIAHALRERGFDADRAKRYEEAIALYTQALGHHSSTELQSTILVNRGVTHGRMGEREKAAQDYSEAIRLDPKLALAYYNRGDNAREMGQVDQALNDFTQVIRLRPGFAPAYVKRGKLLVDKGEFAKASAEYDVAIRGLEQSASTQDVVLLEKLAHMRAASSVALLRNGEQAVVLARKACEMTQWKNSKCLDTLAAAYAESGDFEAAVKVQIQALGTNDFPEQIREEMEKRLELYRRRTPFHHKS